MKLIRVLTLVFIAALLAACNTSNQDRVIGSGKSITETRKVDNFTNIESTCSADVTLVQGGTLAVTIEGENNILPLIETKVSGGKLTIKAKPNTSFRTNKPLIVHITTPALSSIRMSGSGGLKASAWKADNLALETNGSGDIRIDNLQVSTLTARLTGSGDITIRGGTAKDSTVQCSGSGDFDGSAFESKTINASLSGSGNATVWATVSLAGTLSGSGDLLYYGTPGLTQSASGSGHVEKQGDHP